MNISNDQFSCSDDYDPLEDLLSSDNESFFQTTDPSSSSLQEETEYDPLDDFYDPLVAFNDEAEGRGKSLYSITDAPQVLIIQANSLNDDSDGINLIGIEHVTDSEELAQAVHNHAIAVLNKRPDGKEDFRFHPQMAKELKDRKIERVNIKNEKGEIERTISKEDFKIKKFTDAEIHFVSKRIFKLIGINYQQMLADQKRREEEAQRKKDFQEIANRERTYTETYMKSKIENVDSSVKEEANHNHKHVKSVKGLSLLSKILLKLTIETNQKDKRVEEETKEKKELKMEIIKQEIKALVIREEVCSGEEKLKRIKIQSLMTKASKQLKSFSLDSVRKLNKLTKNQS